MKVRRISVGSEVSGKIDSLRVVGLCERGRFEKGKENGRGQEDTLFSICPIMTQFVGTEKKFKNL